MITNLWNIPATITKNNFVYKSLSNWALNFAVGCNHACRFCYVPDASTIKLSGPLAKYGVQDPDAEWGEYVLVRPHDEPKFLRSLAEAEGTPRDSLKTDGNRAVFLCSTTDAYQVLKPPYLDQLRTVRRRCLELIRDESTLNVRILTRSPLVREDFDLLKSFGTRLLLGMSIPTLRNDLAKIYEPKAPAPSQRLETLKAAKAAGLNVYVAMAPTYPECDGADLLHTLTELKELDPVTIFHEPINIRAENVKRIASHAKEIGATMKSEVFATTEAWRRYAIDQLMQVQGIARMGKITQLHLWPDKSLGSKECVAWAEQHQHTNFEEWLRQCWGRISEWPTLNVSSNPPVPSPSETEPVQQ